MGHFRISSLPSPLQWQPVFSIAPFDFDKDGKLDFLAGGNFYGAMPFEGRCDALPLSLYRGSGNGSFSAVFPLPELLNTIKGEVRCIAPIRLGGNRNAMLVAFNNDSLKLFKY